MEEEIKLNHRNNVYMKFQTRGGDGMTAKRRIATIRLSEKLERNPEYAKKMGISVSNRKADTTEEHVQNNKRK